MFRGAGLLGLRAWGLGFRDVSGCWAVGVEGLGFRV